MRPVFSESPEVVEIVDFIGTFELLNANMHRCSNWNIFKLQWLQYCYNLRFTAC